MIRSALLGLGLTLAVAAPVGAVENETIKLLPSDGAAYDYFGFSVAVSGTTALVGAYFDDDNGSSSGSAYLFDTTTGTQLAKLLPSDGAADDYFGYSVSVSGTTAPYRGLFPSPPLFDRMPTYRTQGKRSLKFLSAPGCGRSRKAPGPTRGSSRPSKPKTAKSPASTWRGRSPGRSRRC